MGYTNEQREDLEKYMTTVGQLTKRELMEILDRNGVPHRKDKPLRELITIYNNLLVHFAIERLASATRNN